MVRGRMTKGITLSTVFIALRLGLSTPDSAPSYGKRERERETERRYRVHKKIHIVVVQFAFYL